MMRNGAWAEKVEKVAKTLFDLTHCVSDIHDVGWPRWASEVDKRNYRSVAEWHVERIRAEHARSVRIVKAEINAVKRDRHNYSTTTRVEMVKRLEGLQAKLQRGRGGKG